MNRISKIIILGFIVFSMLIGMGFCIDDTIPDPPHSIIKAVTH